MPIPITERIESLVRAHEFQLAFSGVMRVERDDEVVFELAQGLANRSDSIPNTPDTRFQVASGCKIFTALSICKLVEQGRLTLETSLRDCAGTAFPHFDPAVTVRQLLTHTSGLPSYFDEEGGQDYEDIWKERPMYAFASPADFLPLFQNARQLFPPGHQFAYNDGAYVLLALIVEHVSGQNFSEFVAQHVFGPAGMADSGYFRLDSLPPRTAHSYVESDDGAWRTNQYAVPIRGGGDGGAFTTAADMGRFWRALLGRRILGDELTRSVLKPAVSTGNDPDSSHYGLGVWIIERADSPRVHSVCGSDPGVHFVSSLHDGGRTIVTILCNAESRPWGLDHKIAAAITISEM